LAVNPSQFCCQPPTRLRGTPRRAPDGFSRRAKCEPNNARQHHPTVVLAYHVPRARSILDPTPRHPTTTMPRVRLLMPRSPAVKMPFHITCPPPAPARAYIYNTAASTTERPRRSTPRCPLHHPWHLTPCTETARGEAASTEHVSRRLHSNDVNIKHASLPVQGPPPNPAPRRRV
jgi:hypothetical protein